MSKFKFVGVSTLNGTIKPRFASTKDRVKVLEAGGHTHITLLELPKTMGKFDAVVWLLGQQLHVEDRIALEDWLIKEDTDSAMIILEHYRQAENKPPESTNGARTALVIVNADDGFEDFEFDEPKLICG